MFAAKKVNNVQQVWANWEKIKKGEKNNIGKSIFDGMPCAGKYAEKSPEGKTAYFETTYKNAVAQREHESPARRLIQRMQEAAEFAAWDRINDRLVFLAHTEIAYRSGKLTNAAACRDLALIAGITAPTASSANKNLVEMEFLVPDEDRRSTAYYADVFSLNVDNILHSLTERVVGSVKSCPQPFTLPNGERVSTHDAFRQGYSKSVTGKRHSKLGRRAGQVYELLLTYSDGLTENELVELTGAHLKTVRSALKRLVHVKDYRTGEVITMVHFDGEVWTGELVDLEQIAAIYETYGARGKQQAQYERERREHRKSLEKGLIQQ